MRTLVARYINLSVKYEDNKNKETTKTKIMNDSVTKSPEIVMNYDDKIQIKSYFKVKSTVKYATMNSYIYKYIESHIHTNI